MLVYEGVLNKENMRKARISTEELGEALREHGVSDVSQVNLAVLEVDGNISVLSENYQTRTVKKYEPRRRAKRRK